MGVYLATNRLTYWLNGGPTNTTPKKEYIGKALVPVNLFQHAERVDDRAMTALLKLKETLQPDIFFEWCNDIN